MDQTVARGIVVRPPPQMFDLILFDLRLKTKNIFDAVDRALCSARDGHLTPSNTARGVETRPCVGAPTDLILTAASILHSLIVATIAERTRVLPLSGIGEQPRSGDLSREGSGGDYQGQLAMPLEVHHPNALRLL